MTTKTEHSVVERKMQMQLRFKAGAFEIETWTEGYPMWMELYHDGQSVRRFHHNELSDLAHVVARMTAQARANMPDRYNHEFD